MVERTRAVAFCLATVLLLSIHSAAAVDLFDRLADPATEPYRISGNGFVRDASHPMCPGDFRRLDISFRLLVNPELGETAIEIESGEKEQKTIDRYFVRRGRIFQVDGEGNETLPASLGDLSPATVAALHPTIVANAIRERRENLRKAGNKGRYLFAWNDELWKVDIDERSGRVARLERYVYSDLFDDGTEVVTFISPGRVVVTAGGRELARLDFGDLAAGVTMEVPAGDRKRDRARLVSAREIELREVAPHLYAIDLATVNTRVMVAEFTDHLAVLEGAYSSRICERIAAQLQKRFVKPVRYFAFSHLHGQYVGGTRSWVHEAATVLVPPTTAPLIEEIVKARHELQPDALSRDPKPLRLETVKERRRLEDGMNVLEIFNVESEHTDEYFIFYFPQQKVLLTGDLLFYRPGQPLSGRSKKLCTTIKELGLDVETFYATWPLDGYGTKNVVRREEMQQGCSEPN